MKITSQYFVDNEVMLIWIDDAGEHVEVNDEYDSGELCSLIRKELNDNSHLYKYEDVESDPWYSKEKIRLNTHEDSIAEIKDTIASDLRMVEVYKARFAKNMKLLKAQESKPDDISRPLTELFEE